MDAARTEEPEPEQPEAEQPAELPDVQALRKTIAELTALNKTLLAEKAAREAPRWLPLKQAVPAGCRYDRARKWAARAVLAGRLHEARKVGGRVLVNATAMTADLTLPAGRE
jgi:hypothetical protein